jgi:hypothetical protein
LTGFSPDFELPSLGKKPTTPCPYREPDPATYPTVAGEQVPPPIFDYILKACAFILSNTFFSQPASFLTGMSSETAMA